VVGMIEGMEITVAIAVIFVDKVEGNGIIGAIIKLMSIN
jgi:hypothetical protein